MRVALHSVLREGAESDYVREHQRIPADLADTFARIGIRNWTIWRSDRDLFHLVDCDDFASAMRELEHDPANLRWQAHIGQFVDHFVTDTPGGGPTPIEQVWELARQ